MEGKEGGDARKDEEEPGEPPDNDVTQDLGRIEPHQRLAPRRHRALEHGLRKLGLGGDEGLGEGAGAGGVEVGGEEEDDAEGEDVDCWAGDRSLRLEGEDEGDEELRSRSRRRGELLLVSTSKQGTYGREARDTNGSYQRSRSRDHLPAMKHSIGQRRLGRLTLPILQDDERPSGEATDDDGGPLDEGEEDQTRDAVRRGGRHGGEGC